MTLKSITNMRVYINNWRDGMGAYPSDVEKYADEIEAEVAERERLLKQSESATEDYWKDVIAESFMPLPKDADGKFIRVGDVVTDGEEQMPVIAIASDEVATQRTIGPCEGQIWTFAPDALKHVKPRTVEDVLEEFLIEFDDWDWNTGGNDRDNARKQLFAKYAEEIRGMMA